jgi:SAM-dependent methyltransferase
MSLLACKMSYQPASLTAATAGSFIMRRLIPSIRSLIATPLAAIALRLCGQTALQNVIFSKSDYPELRKVHGDFRSDHRYAHRHIKGLSKESRVIRGVIVNAVENIRGPIRRALLPGEYNSDKSHYARLFGIDEENIVTAGIGVDMDYEWDYESAPPSFGKFDVIISQAMLEHLLDPYRHVTDLSGMLNPGGHLILHTHIPGFSYHRHPIDCLRFYPDWFEEVAKRLNLSVSDRYIGDLRICYSLCKP